ncbi:MAG: mechanosensitive ion channel family protein [Patescibacteria group bacterium]|nr:mechanosensitive ion channel family protein [Patescibacteria group bacterium]
MFNQLIINNPFLQIEIFGNTAFVWLKTAAVFFIALLILKLFQSILIARLKKVFAKTKTKLDDLIINVIDAIYWPFYVFAATYFAIQFIAVPEIISKWSFYVFMIVVVYYAIKFLSELIDFGAKMIIEKKEDQQSEGIIRLLSSAAKIALWAGAAVLVMANMGYNVTSLITGLGIGGIAIALALQNILGDLFSSLAIYFDKPFKVGDFIVFGDKMGGVKKIGIKTTRIQTPQGEELVVANSELTKSQIRNFGVMEKRRNLQHIGVIYGTPFEKLKRIPDMIKEIIKAQDKAEYSRVHFKSFGDSSLVFEVVYYVLSGDYVEFMDMQENINLAIVEKFNQENIEIAFPTQTVYVKKE